MDNIFIFILYTQHYIVCVVVVISINFLYFELVLDCTRGFAVENLSDRKGTVFSLDPAWIVQYKVNFTCSGTFLTYAYISIPHGKCHNDSHLRWDHV